MPYIANPLEGLPIRNSFITDQSNLGTTPATDDTLIIYDISATALKQLTIANLQASLLVSPAFTGTPTAPTANAGTDTTQLATTAFVTAATTALNTITEMTDVTISSNSSGELLKWNGSAWINNTLAEAGIAPVASPTFTTSITIGSAAISEADLEQIDDLTAGTAVASKALVVDANKDIGTIRNLTIDGVFTDGNYTFDTSGNVSGLGTIGSGNITSSGTIQGTTITATTAFVPDASDGAALGTSSLEFSDLFLADEAVLNFGDDQDVTLTHVQDAGLLLNSDNYLTFRDAALKIYSSADGQLDIDADTEIELTATTVDLNGNLEVSGTNIVGTLTVGSGSLTDSSGAITFGNENLSTTGTLAAGTTTIGTLVLAAASITDSSGTVSFGDENITTSGTVTVGNLTVNGSTTTVDTATLSVEDPLIILASGNNAADSVDIGLYGLYDTSGSQDLYAGLFRDASDSGKWKLFQSLQPAPTTTVNTSGTGYATATLVANLEGNVTGNVTGNASGTAATVTGGTQASITNVANVVEVGALNAGSITSGFGAIDIGSSTLASGAITSSGVITGTGFTIGSAVIVESELEMIDGITAGTAAASKAMVLDASSDITGARNVTITGELDAATGDFSGAVDIAGATDIHGTLDMNDQAIDNIKSATFIAEVDVGTIAGGGTGTVTWANGQKQKVTASCNISIDFVSTNLGGPCNLVLKIIHSGGGRTITWNDSPDILWPGGTAPTLSSSAGTDIVAFYYDGTSYYGQASVAFA